MTLGCCNARAAAAVAARVAVVMSDVVLQEFAQVGERIVVAECSLSFFFLE